MNPDYTDDLDLVQLEQELQSLSPAAPRREFVEALKARMEPVPRLVQPARIYSFPWRRMAVPAAAAAAAVAVMNLDGTRRGPKSPTVASNEVAPAIHWEPMPMRPEFRQRLDAGWVLTADMEMVPPGFVSPFSERLLRLPADYSATRVVFPRQDRFIAPAGYGTPAMNLQWK